MAKEVEIANEMILSKIFYVRGQKVMIDKDLALIYGVKPIRLREQVKRNPERFPGNFMFQLSKEETRVMVSQNAIAGYQSLGGGTMPYVFYRTWNSDVGKCVKKSTSNSNEHKNNRDFYSASGIYSLKQGCHIKNRAIRK